MKAVSPRGLAAARALLAVVLIASATALAACGDDSEERTQVRPPVPRNISVVISQEDITASPAEMGAGQINFLVSNQSGVARTLNIEGAQVSRAVGPIQPEDTATVKVTVQPGDLELAAADADGVRPAVIAVGPERPTAQNELLLP